MTAGIFDSRPTAPNGRAIPEHVSGARDQNPDDIGFWSLLLEDWRTHDRECFNQGFWAIAVHRLGNRRMRIRPKLLRLPFSICYKVANKVVEWTCGISLPYTVRLGRRVRIWHHGGMILHAASIGNDVQIRQTTTLGVARTNHNFELPTIADGADIGAHVCILGDVRVGKDAVIGAGSIVIRDVPDHAVAAGVPARIIKQPPEAVSRNHMNDQKVTV